MKTILITMAILIILLLGVINNRQSRLIELKDELIDAKDLHIKKQDRYIELSDSLIYILIKDCK